MRRLIYILLTAMLFSTIVKAQNNDVEIKQLLNCKIIDFEEWTNSDVIFIKQNGTLNSVVTIQQSQNTKVNHILSDQYGTGNIGYINQNGEGLYTGLRQSCVNNEANLWSVGKNVNTSVIQNGNSNFINSYIDNQILQIHSVLLVQHGNSNRIELALAGNNTISNLDCTISVFQTGNNLEFGGNFESADLPIEIRQKSGNNGGGMSVNVSTSAFSFPMK